MSRNFEIINSEDHQIDYLPFVACNIVNNFIHPREICVFQDDIDYSQRHVLSTGIIKCKMHI